VDERRWRCICRVTGERKAASLPGRNRAESLVSRPIFGIESLLSESIEPSNVNESIDKPGQTWQGIQAIVLYYSCKGYINREQEKALVEF
jgi:hypothetical protein